MPATRLSFSYPQEMKDALQHLAKKDARSLSSYVQKVLNEHIESQEVDWNEVEMADDTPTPAQPTKPVKKAAGPRRPTKKKKKKKKMATTGVAVK